MAIERGSSLQDAMLSFYNAGYPREAIEEAAKAYQMGDNYKPQPIQSAKPPITQQPIPIQNQSIQQSRPPQPMQNNPMQQPKQIQPEQPQPMQSNPIQSTPISQTQQQNQINLKQQKPISKKINPQQKASHYGNQGAKSQTTAIIFLIMILTLFIGGLIALFFFKDSIINFFNTTF